MSDVVHKTTLQYKRSVNTAEYRDGNWFINPDLTAVAGLDPKYWKLSGEAIVPMTQAEQDAKDVELAAQTRAGAIAQVENAFNNDPVQLAITKLIFKEFNKLRVKNGDPAYTVQQFNNALQAEIEASIK